MQSRSRQSVGTGHQQVHATVPHCAFIEAVALHLLAWVILIAVLSTFTALSDCLNTTWYSPFSRVIPVNLLLCPEAATTFKSHMPVIQKVPFSISRWNKISVWRKALLSTTAKYSILQNNFQLYSPEYRHLPHQLDQDAISYSVPSLQPTHTASEALMHSATCAAL